MLTLGSHSFENGLILAPMAGYTDGAMRAVCHTGGAEYAVSEMISAKALCFHDKKTPLLAHIDAREGPVALQIFGSEPEVMAEGARILENGIGGGEPPFAIDINMGCPVAKIAGNGEGSALMREPKKAAAIARAVVRAVSLPVTVKIRAGYSDDCKNAVEVARRLEDVGVSAVAVHGRTRSQMYAGRADYEIIKNVKQALHIPVIGNGDVVDAASALRLKSETGCDGIMIARGAVGNPYLFREIASTLRGERVTPASFPDRIALAKEQVSLAVREKGEAVAVRELRKQLLPYLRGLRGGASLRLLLTAALSEAELLTILSTAVTYEEREKGGLP